MNTQGNDSNVPQPPSSRTRRSLAALLPWAMPLLCTIVAYRTTYTFGFVGDARFLIQDNPNIAKWSMWYDQLTRNYFWSIDWQAIPYWRPFTKMSWFFEYRLFHLWAGGYLIVNLLWHLLGVVGVQLLCRLVGLSPLLAATAALAYGLHPVNIQATCLIMARSDVVAASCCLWSVVCWMLWQQKKNRRWFILHLTAGFVAMASKESSASLPAIVALAAVLSPSLQWQSSTLKETLKTVIGQVAPIACLGAGYVITRKIVLAIDLPPGFPASSLILDPLRIVTGLTRYLSNTWPLAFTSTVRNVSHEEAQALVLHSGALLAIGLLLFTKTARGRDFKMGWVLLGWAVCSILPVLLAKSIWVPAIRGKYALADRWLMHGMPAAITTWFWLFRNARPRVQWGIASVVGVWAVIMLFYSNADRALHFSDATELASEQDQYFQKIPAQYRTPEDRCLHAIRPLQLKFIANDFDIESALLPDDLAHCTDSLGDHVKPVVVTLVRNLKFDQAMLVMKAILAGASSPLAPEVAFSHFIAHEWIGAGFPQLSRTLMKMLMDRQLANCETFAVMGESFLVSGNRDEARPFFAQAYECTGKRVDFFVREVTGWRASENEQLAFMIVDMLETMSIPEDQRALLSQALSVPVTRPTPALAIP